MLSRKIWVRFTKHGIHCYPNAPEDVSYLQQPHRHLFHYTVGIEVSHNDRDIEFHQFQKVCLDFVESIDYDLNYKSCEMLAEDLINYLRSTYPNRSINVDVSEDGECGATLTYTKEES